MISIIVLLILVGLVLWVIEQFPVDDAFRRVLRVIVVVILVLYLINYFFGGAMLPGLRWR